MLRIFPVTLAGVLIESVAATPATADFYFRLRNGDYLVVPEPLFLLFLIAIVLAAILLIATAVSSKPANSTDLPAEIITPEPVKYYEDQASRAQALKRQLDTETELAESYINAKRVRAQLDEIEEMLSHDKAKRKQR
jgi:hypothetical protein